MYSFIEGEIVEKTENYVVVRPDGIGIGFRIFIPPRTSTEISGEGKPVRLHTSFQVKEDNQALYGFCTQPERDLFEALLKISGIGGKTAIAVLDLPRDRIVEAIAAGDISVLRTISGVGPKTAARIVLELKDSFADELMREWADSVTATKSETIGGIPAGAGKDFTEAVEGLVELGYQRDEARRLARKVTVEMGGEISAPDIIRQVLKSAG